VNPYTLLLLAQLLAQRCISVPEEGFENRFGLRPEDGPMEFTRVELDDVDGDRQPDFLLVARQTCGAHNCKGEVYGTNSGCLRRLGRIYGASFRVLSATRSGIRDIEGTWLMGDAKTDISLFYFDGTQYAVAGPREP